MKKFLMMLCLLGAVSLMGCATTQTDTAKANQKQEAQQAQKSGTYFGTGFGVGVASF
jgi:outer membrane lipoprotein SlyB